MKKILALLLIVALLLTMVACGGGGEEPSTNDGDNNGEGSGGGKVKVQDESYKKLTIGKGVDEGEAMKGAVLLDSDYVSIFIPKGIDFEISGLDLEDGLTQFEMFLGKDEPTGGAVLEIGSIYQVSSTEDAVDKMLYYYGGDETTYGDKVSYGEYEYQEVQSFDTDLGTGKDFLITYTKNVDGDDIYIAFITPMEEISDHSLLMDNPDFIEIVESFYIK